jgi:hypothetical protein
VVSRDFDMPGWRAEKLVELDAAGGIDTTLYLWRIAPSHP